jgi:hypothetical protein
MEIDIRERILSDFGQNSLVAISLVEAFEEELKLSPRVTRCIIHLSKGDISKLKTTIHNAEIDWRDIVVLAETVVFEFNKPFKTV